MGIRFTFILNNGSFDTIFLIQNLYSYSFYTPNTQELPVKNAYSFQIKQLFQNASIN